MMLPLLLLTTCTTTTSGGDPPNVDVLVYGATPGGIVAAITAKRMLGRTATVEIIEPLDRVGGMLAGGMVDDSTAGNTRAYGGLAAEYFRRVAHYYNSTDAAAGCFKGEPKVSEIVFREWLVAEGVTLSTQQSITFMKTQAGVLEEATLAPSGRRITAKQFIDASYEGDVIALAGVPFLFGREGKAQWNESLVSVAG
jgi:hypothetical protein